MYYSLGPQYRRIEVFISRPAKVSRLGQSLFQRTVFPKGFSGGLWELGGLEKREKALGTTYPLMKITTGSNRKWGLTAVSQLILFFTISHSLRLSYFWHPIRSFSFFNIHLHTYYDMLHLQRKILLKDSYRLSELWPYHSVTTLRSSCLRFFARQIAFLSIEGFAVWKVRGWCPVIEICLEFSWQVHQVSLRLMLFNNCSKTESIWFVEQSEAWPTKRK